jgi:hypothetical protein
MLNAETFLQGIRYGGPRLVRQRRRMDGKSNPSGRDNIRDGWMRNQMITALSLILLYETLVTPPEKFLLFVSLV